MTPPPIVAWLLKKQFAHNEQQATRMLGWFSLILFILTVGILMFFLNKHGTPEPVHVDALLIPAHQ